MRILMTLLIGACAGAGVVFALMRSSPSSAGAPALGSQAAARPAPSGAERKQEPPAEEVPTGYWQPGLWSWISAEGRQRYDMTDFRDLIVTDERWSPRQGKWVTLSHESSASFDMLRAASAHQDLFCFAGLADNGDFVLERWRLEPVTFPFSGGSAQVASVEGLVPKRFRKAEIARGRLADEVLAVEFDLEERFILVLVIQDGVWQLQRYENRVGATPVVLLDSVNAPLLAEMHHLQKFDHVDHGRMWILQSDPLGSWRIALLDAGNDGQFDGAPVQGDAAWFESLGIVDDSLRPLISP